MSQTVIGVFDSYTDAQQAAQALISQGIDRDDIRISAQSAQSGSAGGTAADDKGFWSSLKDSLGFGDDDDRYGYREAARRGGTVVSVDAADNQVDSVVTILQRYKAVNLDERASQWKDQGWSGYSKYESATSGTGQAAASASGAAQQASARTASASQTQQRTPATAQAGGEKLEVVQEELQVGKRAVAQGGIRVHQRVTEKPVQAQVNLREERVTVDRKAVDRPVTAADEAFHNRTIEATATSEQAVVGKTARVVEEVSLNKEAHQRTETVRDTVKRQDVEVEQIAGGQTEERFRPAYAFADELSQDQRYRGKDWSAVETDARRSFEQRHPQSKWDEMKDAIRSRYDRARTAR
ncbi:MAG TPA: YsnF/AvaK domain-containing protein [Humisphaera sp.]